MYNILSYDDDKEKLYVFYNCYMFANYTMIMAEEYKSS